MITEEQKEQWLLLTTGNPTRTWGITLRNQAIRDLLAENARLTARVAELEGVAPLLERVREVERSLDWDMAEAMTEAQLTERLSSYMAEAGM